MGIYRTLGSLLILGWCVVSPAVSARELSLEERVQAQKAMEQVYWSHRIWPKENPGSKPALSAVMPDAAIRARVEDTMKKSALLGTFWRHPITHEQLQAEMERIVKQSRDPRTLRELFDALGNDPFVIAETLARTTLTERMIRSWYASDDRIHGALKRQANEARARCARASCMKAMGGEYRETTVTLGGEGGGCVNGAARPPDVRPGSDGGACDAAMERAGVVSVDEAQWTALIDRLGTLGGAAGALPRRALSSVDDTTDALRVTAVLSRRETEIVLATTTWPKRPFDEWWEAKRREVTVLPDLRDGEAAFSLPATASTSCTNDTWSPTHQEVPDGRSGHTAVWTGSEMIVWGGNSGGLDRRSGGRYDPSTDAWTMTSMGANVPQRREGHTAVWTGTEMIVWGGFDQEDPFTGAIFNSGGRYDPASDTWMPTSTGANVPLARSLHTAVWTGTEMIVWGGIRSGGTFVNTGGRYDPATDTWAPTSTGAGVPASRYRATAVWAGDAMIVWGGRLSTGFPTSTGGRYHPASNTWMPTSTGAGVPSPREYDTAVWTGSRMIVWGGRVASTPPDPANTNSGGSYDPSTDTWTATSMGENVPHGRSMHTAVWTGSEMIVWGGQHNDPSGQTILDTGGRYDPLDDTWSPLSTGVGVAGARMSHTAVWTGLEMIVWGGDAFIPVGLSSVSTGGRYDPASDTWTPTSNGATVGPARTNHIAVWSGAEMIVWGGYDPSYVPTRSGARYSPATDSWTPTSIAASTPSAGILQGVWTGREMIVWGSAQSQTAGGRYDPSTDSWAPVSLVGAPPARSVFAHVWTGTEMVVWGGQSGGPSLVTNTGGRYDPAMDHWTTMSTGANVPVARRYPAGVWTGTHVIVWGGATYNGSFASTNTGGRYDPATDQWTPTSTGTNVPSPRSSPAVWTGSRMIVWGGSADVTGGLYDPVTDQWTPTSTGAGVPTARGFHTIVWTGKEMIVWGGVSGNFANNKRNTGARYDPLANAWSTTSTGLEVPEPRAFHSAVWTGASMIVWGGEAGLPSSSGGIYCACPLGALAYRDLDGDGYGNSALSLPSCDGSIPAGYVTDPTDCDDTDTAVHPGATEICNALDDDCDGAVDTGDLCHDSDVCTADACLGGVCQFTPMIVPEVNASLVVSKVPAGVSIDWNDAPGFFNLYRGSTTGTPWTYAAACFRPGATNPSTDPDLPAPGILVYYLVSRSDDCGESAIGRDSDGAEIPNSAPCP